MNKKRKIRYKLADWVTEFLWGFLTEPYALLFFISAFLIFLFTLPSLFTQPSVFFQSKSLWLLVFPLVGVGLFVTQWFLRRGFRKLKSNVPQVAIKHIRASGD